MQLPPKVWFKIERLKAWWRSSFGGTNQSYDTSHRMCPECRALIPRGTKVCPHCGVKIGPQRARGGAGTPGRVMGVIPTPTSATSMLAAAIVLATVLDFTPRARRSTRGEGEQKGWFYVAVWTVVPTQLASWAMWRLGRFFDLSTSGLGEVRLATFLLVAAFFFALGYAGKLPRTERYIIPEGTISDMEVSAGM